MAMLATFGLNAAEVAVDPSSLSSAYASAVDAPANVTVH